MVRSKLVLATTFLLPFLVFPATKSKKIDDSGFRQWKAKYGKLIDMKAWSSENPRPYSSYFPSSKVDSMANWFVSLGPLGVHTRMHDRSWVDVFSACKELSPKELTDDYGLVKNVYEVTISKSGGPADGLLKKGDLILKLDGEELKEAQLTYLGKPLGNRNCRGLDISAGQLIDRAEGRGKIKVTVLRVPEGKKQSLQKALKGLRKWKKVKSVGSGEFNVMLDNMEIIKLSANKGTKIESLTLSNASGISFPLENSGKRGGSTVNCNLVVPEGKWQLRGNVVGKRSPNIKIEGLAPVKLPAVFDQYLKDFELKIPKIGSFGNNFDPSGEKARNYSKILAYRIAKQQLEDGSWKAKSYGTPSFFTSMCGLALMSTNDPQYKEHIRKAALYVANGEWDKWTYIAGTRLTFLAEYYLRTKDKAVVPGLKIHLAESHRYVCADYTAGHSHSPGYGGSGYIGGGGILACGLAVASHTPYASSEDKYMLDKMLERVQQIAPGGKVPYGRAGSPKSEPVAGQGGGCGTGPYFFASLIRGGAEHFTKTAAKRYGTGPWGTAENGHATQTIHFVWGALASANCGGKALRGCMNSYLWKFALLRNFDGFTSENNYRTEYHNGDGVIGPPFWRSAGYLILMNAYKRNLAITGSPKYRAKKYKETPVVFHRDISIYNFVKRSWYIVEAALGSNVPKSLKVGISKLEKLPKNEKLGVSLRKFMKSYAPAIARDIMAVKKVDRKLNAEQLVESLYGVSIEASCTPDLVMDMDDDYSGGSKAKKENDSSSSGGSSSSKEDKKAAKKAAKKLAKKNKKQLAKDIADGKSVAMDYLLNLRPFSIIQREVSEGKSKESGFNTALFDFENIELTVTDPSKKYLKKTLHFKPKEAYGKVKKGEMGADGFQYRIPMTTDAKGSFEVTVKYTLNGTPLSYKTKLDYPAKEARSYVPNLNKIKLKGTVSEDYQGVWTCRVKLKTGRVIGCEQWYAPTGYILAGTPCEFEISPTGRWAHNLRSVKKLDSHYRTPKPSSITVSGGDYFGDLKNLTDGDINTSVRIGGVSDGEKVKRNAKGKETTITYTYSKPIKISSGVFSTPSSVLGKSGGFRKVEAFVKGKWQPIRNHTQFKFFKTLVAESNKFRVTFTPGGAGMQMAELYFNQVSSRRRSSTIKRQYTW